MAHKAQLENKKYRNWVRAGLGIKYVKEGLEPFCEHLVKQQHNDIFDKVKRKHNLSTLSCGLCDVNTLQPDHVQTKTRQCPLGQMHCNCQHSREKNACPNKVCGAIYDEIIQLHASTPPTPYWRNTDAKQWFTEPWAVAKCFINSPGYEQKNTAAEFDCTGLLHVLLNNIDFQQHIKCVITGSDVLSRVRKIRNDIFHSDNMELEDTEVYSYIGDMIELLEDDKEIKHRQESKDAVKKLQELKHEHFIISTKDEADIRRAAMAAISEKEKEVEQTITDADNKLKTTADEQIQDIEGKGSIIKSELEQTRQTIRQNLTKKEIEATGKLEQKLEESKLQLQIYKNLIERSIRRSAGTRKDVVGQDFQKKLVKLYERDVTKLTPLPRLYQIKMNVDDMYVHSLMTEDIKNDECERWEEVKISMDKIFRNNEEPVQCIYVIGEAGSGKTTFCKMLVHFWCMAHSEQEGSSNEPDIVHEMKRFDFLFYVSLRYYSDCDCIKKMLEKSFYDPALGDILQNGSSKCLIVLDGLDEWNLERNYISQFQNSGLPGRELNADYTIITTSRQWKFDALSLSDSEVGKKIKLKGIVEDEMKNLTVKTVETLNDIFKKNRNSEECILDLRSRKVSDISHTPLMLQQLVCLWYNDKLQGNSKCAIYGNMLDLFLEWKSLETSEIQDQLYVFQTRNINEEVKRYLSKLAYETLFDQNKESTLTFNSSKLTQLSIPHDVIKDCLASGILKEERNISLIESMQSTISFFHKSVQEFLAALYIASQFKEMLPPNDVHALANVGKKCVDKYFDSCKTVVDILEQSNVFIMLCGVEPQLLTNVSEYIYNVSLVDKIVVKERNKIPNMNSSDHPKLIIDIQTCIFNCLEEVLSSTQCESVHAHVYIADLYVSRLSTDLQRHCHNIILKNIRSIKIQAHRYIFRIAEDDPFYLAVKYLTKCDQLKIIKFNDFENSDKRIYNEVSTILAKNVNTLDTVSLININEIKASRFVSTLQEMRQLTSVQVTCKGVCVWTFSNIPYRTSSRQYISRNINWEKFGTLMIDLSKHKQLQHVDFMFSLFCMVRCNTDNLETCTLSITNVDKMNQLCNILCKAGKLKQLILYGERELRSKETETRDITDNLITLLPSLGNLSTLMLDEFTLTDNIITCPCDMKNLKEIKLSHVTMSMTTWFKFIYCLPVLPQVVTVTTIAINIKHQTSKQMRDENQVAGAQQYVRQKTTLFHATHGGRVFKFTTKKT